MYLHLPVKCILLVVGKH